MGAHESKTDAGAEFTLKWEMGARGAVAIVALLSPLAAKIEIQREEFWFDAKNLMWFMMATRSEDSSPLVVRASGPDAGRAVAELARVFNCDSRPPCSCGEPRLIGWNRHGGEFVCAKGHTWLTAAESPHD